METRTNILDFTKQELMELDQGLVEDANKNSCQTFIAKDTMQGGIRFAAFCYRTGSIPKKNLVWHRLITQEFSAGTSIEKMMHSIEMSASGYDIDIPDKADEVLEQNNF
jgi:hypothetical protein